MVFFEGEAKDSEEAHIGAINCAPPFTHQRVHLNVEIESTHGEKTEVSVDPLSSRGINKFHLEGDFHLESDLEVIKVYQCLSKLSRSLASYESPKQHESNLNSMTDMNSEATKQPILPDTSTCVADQNDALSKDSVIDYVRKTDEEYVPISNDRARAESVRKFKHVPWDRESSRILYKKTSSLFSKDKVIRNCMVHYLKKNVLSSFKLRKCLSLGFRKYIAVRMSRPACRPQLRHNKSSRVGDSNRRVYLTTRRTAEHKKDMSVILCIQGESATKRSTKLNQQNESFCVSREKLLISGDIESNPGPVSHGTRAHIVLRNPSMALLQARLAQQGLEALECTSDGSCFFSSVAHQLYNDPSYHMNVRAAGVDYIRNNRERFIGPITDQLWVSYLTAMSQQHTWCDALIVQAVSDALNITIRITESIEGWTPVTVISPISGQQGTTVINIGHVDERHYVSSVPLDYSNDRISNSEMNSVTYVNNYPEVITDELTMAKNDVNVSNDFSKAEAKRAYMRESIRRKRQNKEFREKESNAKRQKRSENIEAVRGYEKQAFVKRKASNPERVRELNRKAQTNLRKAMQNSNVNQTEILQGQDSIRHSMSEVIQSFHDKITHGPEYICTCCDQLWYRSSVSKCNSSNYSCKCSQSLLEECITGTKSVDDTEWICSTCHSNLTEGKLPACSKANKMQFPKKTECLNLTPLEERLISPRIPFMQIRELPRGGHLSIHGNVVNVPADVSSTVTTLPRPINESQTIPIKLKRRLSYKHHYQYENVRPAKVLEAANYFMQTSELFQKEQIQVQEIWQENMVTALSEPTAVGVSNIDEWEEFFNVPTTSSSVPDLHSNENIT